MDRYLAHEFALVREQEIRTTVKKTRTTDVWDRSGSSLSERVGRTLIHLGTRLLREESTVLNFNRHLPRAAA